MSERARILVIDDDEDVRKVLATALRRRGFVVDTAKDGREAIEKSGSTFYNLALVDIRLPDMEGTRLLSETKRTTPKMVHIILTGYPTLQNAVEAVNKGADGYLVKPVNMEQLLTSVEEHLKKQQEARRYSEEKVVEYIETRAKELEKGQKKS